MSTRIEKRFQLLKDQKRAGLITFTTAGDPDPVTFAQILAGLPKAGADIIELGMPFTDPMADGPVIQRASLRALKAGMSVKRTLKIVADFRLNDQDTPIVLMGYFNPIMAYGISEFVKDAAKAGVDGLIIADLPPEEDAQLRLPANEAGLAMIRLAAPTTDDQRLPRVLDGASGFLYYVAIAGVTGTKSAADSHISEAVTRIRAQSSLPVAVGFGIRTADHVAQITSHADAAIVGSAIISEIESRLDQQGRATAGLVDETLNFVQSLASGLSRNR